MIKPYGSDVLSPRLVDDPQERAALTEEAGRLPSVVVSQAAAASVVMLGSGYFNPLTGFMNVNEAVAVADELRPNHRLFWPVPVLNVVRDASGLRGADKIALRDPNIEGHPVLAVMELDGVQELSYAQLERIAHQVFRTADPKHPGVAAFMNQGNVVLSGPVRVLNFSYFERDFPQIFRTASQVRREIDARGWKTVVALQTRDPMLRSHEALCRMAMEATQADGLVIHMLLGRHSDQLIPASIRYETIRKTVETVFSSERAMITGSDFDMISAGPREALAHAIFRQNAGCTHLIVGPDHAAVGSFYGPFDAQAIFEKEVPHGVLAIDIFKADRVAYSKKLGKFIMMREAAGHPSDDLLLLSDADMRGRIAAGQPLPPEWLSPEVSEVLARLAPL